NLSLIIALHLRIVERGPVGVERDLACKVENSLSCLQFTLSICPRKHDGFQALPFLVRPNVSERSSTHGGHTVSELLEAGVVDTQSTGLNLERHVSESRAREHL